MPVNNFSVGRDVSLTLTNPNGNLTLSGLTQFDAKPVYTAIKSKRISDGKTHHAQIPDGWEGSFKLDRLDPSVDIFFANLEAGYYAGQNTPSGTIQEIIAEADGSTTTWSYDEVVLKLDDAGSWAADKKVDQAIGFNATTKTQVS
ncbi:MAG: hypothetical protein WAL34_04010 [Acidobacteriaceae bacterium]